MKLRKIAAALTFATLGMNIICVPIAFAEEGNILSSKSLTTAFPISDNISENSYRQWYNPIYSYLNENSDGTISRIEYSKGESRVNIETYSSDYKFIESKTIKNELSRFGGLYCGDKYNYIVFGQENVNESDSCEVMRVVKYNKNWDRIDSYSVFGANTKIPFYYGSLRMTELNGILYVYTCHVMYKSSDGYNHQSNMTFVIDSETMQEKQSYYGILNIEQAGYVSHSFNQFIETDGDHIFRADHGDAYPRGISITRCGVQDSIKNVTYTITIEFGGNIGDINTGATMGGFELSSENCLIAGNSIVNGGSQRNIFLTVTDKNLSNTNTIWLTDFKEGSSAVVGTPHLLKYDDERFLIMWEEIAGEAQDKYTKMLIVNGEGKKISDVVTSDSSLSDCEPIVASDGNVKWYVSNSESIELFDLDVKSLEMYDDKKIQTKPVILLGDVIIDGKIDISDVTAVLTMYARKSVGLSNDEFTEEQKQAADINCDGEITISDATQILNVYAGNIASI